MVQKRERNCNPVSYTHLVRTADMMDMVCVIFVRGKDPTPEMIELANDREIVLMKTPLRMFTACGLLYSLSLIHI